MTFKERPCSSCKKLFIPTRGQVKCGVFYPVYKCNKCVSLASVEYAKKHMGQKLKRNKLYFKRHPEAVSHHGKKYRERYPEKRKAHMLVLTEIRSGRMIKQPCEKCGNKKANAHHDDYSKPLSVRWLCTTHHIQHHRAMLEEGKKP